VTGSSDPVAAARLNVAVVAPSFGILGGHAVQADALLRAWRRDADVAAWLVPINPRPPRLLEFTTRIKYLRTVVNELVYAPSLVRELRSADVVHVFSASYSSFVLAALPAILIARALGRPVILNYHSGHATDHLRRSRLTRAVLRSVDGLVVPSPFLEDVFRAFGLNAAVVPNIVNADRFAYRERSPLRPRILSTRNLAYPYNVGCSLRAFRLIQDRRPDASLTVVGSGRDERELRALAAELRLTNVRFAGRVEPSAIHHYYADHDIYLQSPDIDNMPISVLEAFASGLPVVSTDAGGVPTLAMHGERGLLAPIGDHQALADRVLTLLDQPELAQRLAAAGRAACRGFEWPAVRPLWLDAYRRAMLARNRGCAALSASAS
jgi:glycosyltransferase involved in cell wall biosynthesis